MHRILLSGLGLALGVFATPAAGQDPRTNPPQQRGARLGRPEAIPDPVPNNPTITPVGLLTPRQPATTTGGHPPAGMPTTGAPFAAGPAAGTPTLPPRVVPGGPSIIEDRGSAGGTLGHPTAMPGVPSLVPSVAPQGEVIGQPGLECPLYDGVPVGGAPIEGVPVGDPVAAGPMGRVAGLGKAWTSAEYMMWWTRSANIPALVTTSSPAASGRLGVGDTRVLLGGSFGETFHSGLRVGGGYWFGTEQRRGVDVRLFFLGQAASTFTATTAQYPLLARPFNNVNPDTPFPGSSSEIIADNIRATGGVQVHLENTVWGAEANYRRFLWSNPCARLDGIVGYRYLNMNEKLSITEQFVRTGAPIGNGFPAMSGTVIDEFRTNNEFHGGQIGLAGEIRRGRWSLDGRASVAFGNLSRTQYISGSQNLVMADGSRVLANGGLLAIPGANVGKFTDNVFSVIPEVGVNLGYQLTSRMRIFVGYNFLYMGNALRPGDAIDTSIDSARIPNFLFPATTPPIAGTPRPTPQFRSSDFFIQGINFGLQFNW